MEANLIPEIEKLIAKYQGKVSELNRYASNAANRDVEDMLRLRAGQIIQVIDDLNHLAGIK
jgi:hypothetical protein